MTSKSSEDKLLQCESDGYFPLKDDCKKDLIFSEKNIWGLLSTTAMGLGM